ncbi:electron transfer protein 1 [Coniophora puteana RWD-64-598 SS2]|uniref:Electron transfer protein 1 n=1 Tax=Coniophora puteana (strain RWD-64-598) TaxID=741705 RepID=A0A5M3MUP9_CONPW|nr:electron transfer protein 1 [Coniophora puteana RWD-64-598 SS2]EIW82484.1 electron transfer protein 1 [Coniophora puteana RWD-64-598 SS2]
MSILGGALSALSRPALRGSFQPLSNGLCRNLRANIASRLTLGASRFISRSATSNIKPQHLPGLRKPLESRFFSANGTFAPAEASLAPTLAPPAVGRWLLASSALVFGVIVVGGVTRLTESGLSITEWRPITGVLPPLSLEEWTAEFEKYQATPEFKLLNHSITLDEFKKIFFWEWSHRVLGRVIGVGFVVPLAYFAFRKKLSRSMPLQLTGMALLLGAQGFLGWYMVKSGLEESIMTTPGAVPRVSQYRLAAHLGTAFVLYCGMLASGLAVIKDWKFSKSGIWSGSKTVSWQEVTSNPAVRRFMTRSKLLTGLVFLTALSGAFVAGLDAGLVYNEFPLMGGRLVPPTDELFATAYAKSADGSDLWRNIFENPTTVQFNHRVLATATYISTWLLWAQSRNPAMRAVLPPLARVSINAALAMANVQVLLGLATLLYMVPIPIAASHQAGSVALLSTMVHLLVSLRRPGMAARWWRTAGAQASKTKS